MYERISNKNLDSLIEGLEFFKAKGVIDPWVFSDGTKIEPLDVLKELRDWRTKDELKRTGGSMLEGSPKHEGQ